MGNRPKNREIVTAFLQKPWIELTLRILLGVIFIYASIPKIGYPSQFAKIIYGYALFPAALINLIAIIVPYVEIVMGASLILGIYPRAAASILAGMLSLFIIAISINLIRGHEFDCGCFSLKNSGLSHSAGMLLFRDIIYFFISIFIIRFEGKRSWCIC